MTDDTDLRTQYAAKLEADLRHNVQEKERIAAEMTALKQQLDTLDSDHTLLVGMRQALAREPAAGKETPPPPPAAQASATDTAKKAAGAPVPRPRKTAADKPTAKSPATAASKPTLRELVVTQLGTHTEPTSAAEITAALSQTHPERPAQVTVVRNTLEGLVAKGQALRTKQKRAVFYTAVPADTEDSVTSLSATPDAPSISAR